MADAIAQSDWRKRKKLGLIQKVPCPNCGKILRGDSKDICRICWLQTDEGREYTRLKVARHRKAD